MRKRIFNEMITAEHEGVTLLSFLKEKQFSASTIVHLKRTKEGLLVNGIWATIRQILHQGDTVTIQLCETESSAHIVPMPLPLTIVYEDEDLMVINKPADMPIHPSQGNFDNTLANGLAYYFQEKGEPFTYRCINRLDRDTTGLLIVAKHMHSASILSRMVSKRKIKREYLAIATGLVPEEGCIDAPIGRVFGSTIEREVNWETGESARTNYRRLAYENGYSLVSLQLETGRTHQIRVHMKHIGHPLPGDFLYNPTDDIIKRQALHSYRLSFLHPITKEELSFVAPLPSDMQLLFPTF